MTLEVIMKMRLQYWREKRFLSIRQLAVRSGVHANTIVDIEKGRRWPKEETMQKLASILEVTLDQLTEDEISEK